MHTHTHTHTYTHTLISDCVSFVCEFADDSFSVCSDVIILIICVNLFQQHLHTVYFKEKNQISISFRSNPIEYVYIRSV